MGGSPRGSRQLVCAPSSQAQPAALPLFSDSVHMLHNSFPARSRSDPKVVQKLHTRIGLFLNNLSQDP